MISLLKTLYGHLTTGSRQVHRKKSVQSRSVEFLESREVPTVYYYGGELIQNVSAQALYLGSGWNQQSSTQPMDAFLSTLTNSSYMDALTNAGYGVGRGTAITGANDNINIPAGSTISNSEIQSRIQQDISSGLLHSPDRNSLYVVYVQPDVAVSLGMWQGTTQQGILGYHGAFGGADTSGNPITIHYAVVAYPGGSVGNSSLGTSASDQLTAVTSHEIAEAVTDPNVNYGRLGWYDPNNGEIGDITSNDPNSLVKFNGYLVQEMANKNDQILTIPADSPISTPIAAPITSTLSSTSASLSISNLNHRRWGPSTARLTVIIDSPNGSSFPTGSVDLMLNNQIIGTTDLIIVNGKAEAVFNLVFYGRGSFNFSANYSGDTNFEASSSNNVTLRI